MKVLFVWPNKDAYGFKPIGLSLLSAIARNIGWETKLFDTTQIDFGFKDNTMAGEAAKVFKPIDMSLYGHEKKSIDLESQFTKVLKEFNPDCLAFTVLADEAHIAAQLTLLAKKLFHEIPIIWGGKYPTIKPEETLSSYDVDFVCVGEGIDAFREFLMALGGNNRIDILKIPNIWAKQNGKIIKNDIRPINHNLDDLPYIDWSIFDTPHFYKPYDGNAYVSGDHMLNWGCPYHCTYCINHYYHKMYNNRYLMRRYGVNRIINELKFLKSEYNLQFFKFHDEDFLMRPIENFRELSAAYKKEINLPFVIETNPKSVTEEKAELLKNMNCVSASLAIETGDPELRKNLLKRVDSEQDIIRAFSIMNDASIRTAAFFMLGIPFETRATYEKSINLARKAKVRIPSPGFFYPFEGTDLRTISIKEGFFDPDDKETMFYKRDTPALKFSDFTTNELIEMRNVFNLYVKLPEVFKPFIERSEKLDELGEGLRAILIELYDKTVFENDGWYTDNGSGDKYLIQMKLLCEEFTRNALRESSQKPNKLSFTGMQSVSNQP